MELRYRLKLPLPIPHRPKASLFFNRVKYPAQIHCYGAQCNELHFDPSNTGRRNIPRLLDKNAVGIFQQDTTL